MNPGNRWYVLAAFTVAVIGTGLMRRYALRRKLLDVPNVRSSHSVPTPRGGGVAIVVAYFIAMLGIAGVTPLASGITVAVLAGGGAIAWIGFVDDRQTISARVRLGVHVAAAIFVVVLIGGLPDPSLARWGLRGAEIGFAIAVLMLVCMTNIFNFMDGIDGLAASEAVFIGLAGAWVTWYQSGDSGTAGALLCLAAASGGFLLWNVSPARIFMGDVGSGFLGFAMATLGLISIRRDGVPMEVFAILGGFFLTDATITLFRRMVRGDAWLAAHRTHAYQHLARRWKSHLPVTLLVVAINLFWLLPWAILAARIPTAAAWFLAAALIPVALLVFALGAGRGEP
jgi:Fuc2NAc and GlcNAc transferase